MKLPSFAVLGLLALASCNAGFPRDPEGTLDRVRMERSFRVGLVAPLAEGTSEAKVDALLARIGKVSGASPSVEQGDAEPLLKRLEEGEIDLVIGRFEKKSPWKQLVTFGPPLRIERHGKAEFHLAPLMRNGENAWIALVEREARDVAPEAQ
jgi:hypothetical protein